MYVHVVVHMCILSWLITPLASRLVMTSLIAHCVHDKGGMCVMFLVMCVNHMIRDLEVDFFDIHVHCSCMYM